MINAGYTFALFDGLNRFYVSNGRADLLPMLPYSANFLDDYITHREAELQMRLEVLEKQVNDPPEVARARAPHMQPKFADD